MNNQNTPDMECNGNHAALHEHHWLNPAREEDNEEVDDLPEEGLNTPIGPDTPFSHWKWGGHDYL